MALREEAQQIAAFIQSCQGRLKNSEDLLKIYENDLLPFILEMFKREMGQNTYEAVITRIPPINILIKIVDKLSRIYQSSPMRVVEGGSDQDKDLVDYYVDLFDMDVKFNQGNEFLNLDRINLMQPFYDELNQKPSLRAVPNDKFLVYSDNKYDPTVPTHAMLNKGKAIELNPDKRRSKNPRLVDVWIVWTAEEIGFIDEDGNYRADLMAQADVEGFNPYGVIPFQYVNSSQNFLIPPSDSDTKRMTVLIPALMADLNYAAKFQSFSQIIAYNWDTQNITMAPNAIQFVNQSRDTDDAPSMDVIKPQVDITEVAQWIVTQLSLWLNSRGIRPGSIGDLSAQNLASGVSKIIDEMDTAEIRQKQAELYSRAETDFWDKVLNHMHPIWVAEGKVDNKHVFTQDAKVLVEFPKQKPIINRAELVTTAIQELNAGLKAPETVIAELNPQWSEERIQEEMELIQGEPEPESEPTTSLEEAIENEDGTAEDQD